MRGLPLVLVCFSIVTFQAFSQQTKVDSLLQVIKHAPDDKARADLLCQASSACYHDDLEQGYAYAERAYTLARQVAYARGMRYALILKGYYFQSIGEYGKSLVQFRQAIDLKMPMDDLLGYGYCMIGNLYRTIAKYDSADLFYTRALTVLRQVHSRNYLAITYKSQAKLYILQWKNAQAYDALMKALRLYQEKGDRYNVADTWFQLAKVSKSMTHYKQADEYVVQACALAHALNDEFLQLHCQIGEGQVKFDAGEYTAALEHFFSALKMLEKTNTPATNQEVYYSIGKVYEQLAQNDLALKYFFEALRIAERLKDKYESARALSNIAWIYKNQVNFEVAHEYLDRSLKLREEIHDEYGLSSCYNVLGMIYLQEKQYDKSLKNLQQSLSIRRKIGHREGISASLFSIGLVYEARNNDAEALRYQLEALVIDEQIGNKFALGVSYNTIGNLYIKTRQYAEAHKYLLRAQSIGEELHSKNLLMNNNLFWSKYYEATGDIRKALATHQRYTQLKDSIYSENSSGRLAELEALYQVQRKNQEITLLNQQKQLQDNQIRIQESKINLQNTVILFAIVGSVLISSLALITYQYNKQIRKANREISEQKEEIQAQSEELTENNQRLVKLNEELIEKTEEIQAQSEELRETNEMIIAINHDLDDAVSKRTAQLNEAYKELDTFFYRSSHDFRRPLTTFMGLAEVAKVTIKDQTALDLFDKVRETARSLDKMLIKLQSISDVGAQQLVYKEVLIEEIFLNVCEDFREELEEKGMKTYCEVKMLEPLVSYPAMIRIVFENMIENSITFSTPVDPYIKFQVYQEKEECVMILEDNGQGIQTEYQDRVFEMYFRGSDRSKGNGLGLYIVRKAIGKLHGTIALETNLDKGSRFTIRLPIGQYENLQSTRFKV
ncbi:tetratricopeptide repeat-containing sensor histidine kinase [Ohtaekwangia sp.]|uniref:tetratricopeptide repeat-containing sensor histidine kinase n=1 Tax=Ohtaekwangia sp. TaxID=2066019 RepID=UPI002FDEC988